MASLGTPVESLPRVSKKIVPALKHLGIHTVRDLLLYLPTRYDDFSRLKKIRYVAVGETVTVRGRVKKITARRTAKKYLIIVEAVVEDETGQLRAVWFNQPFLARNLKAGDMVSLAGKVTFGQGGMYLQNPAYEKLTSNPPDARLAIGGQSPATTIHTGGLVAVYPETRGVTSRWLRFLIYSVLAERHKLIDPLPRETRRKYQLPELKDAVLALHAPKNFDEANRARKRFSFEELLFIQMRSLQNRAYLKNFSAPVIPLDIALVKSFVQSLPFVLTNAQRRSMWEIFQDLAKPRPMNRLLEGDVGSGKTVVASAASLCAVRAGCTVAFMAPTEILARQHFETLRKILAPFSVSVALMTGSEKNFRDGADIVVGTHALIQKNVMFENLGLVIVDEQHRFGVEQRARLVTGNQLLVAQRLIPHFLSMSATPIPRTLALTIYGDLDLSLIDEMPKGRKEIITRIVEPQHRDEAYQFIRREIRNGGQVFVICPRIESQSSEDKEAGNISGLRLMPDSKQYERRNLFAFGDRQLLADVKTVKAEYEKLSKKIFPDLRIGMLHGRLKSKEKDTVMKKFKNRELDILVSTSVIEVGVDVPNATTMVIEGAERFGLAQLHQFRGRVGRGGEQSHCFLFPTEDGVVTRRLRAIVDAKTGFELAEKDLEIRGAGDLLGTRQSGLSSFALMAAGDPKLVRDVRREAAEILAKDPALLSFPALKERLNALKEAAHFE